MEITIPGILPVKATLTTVRLRYNRLPLLVSTIGMIQNLSFSGKEDENPYLHIRDFEQTCDCLRIEGISDKTLRWKLFPFSLRGEARQWYSQKVSQQ